MPEKNNLSNLPSNLRVLHESQKKWRDKAWETTLSSHKDELEKMLEKINLFDIWSDGLQNNEAIKRLLPEIFMDGYMSIYFAGCGLYKYANICLRSQLETALRLIYFSTHPIEFDWWCNGNTSYRSGLANKDVWGEGYLYFQELKYVQLFEEKCSDGHRLFRDGKKVSNIYRKLSTYVHSGMFSFQTKPDEFSPQYKIEDFKHWCSNLNEIQEYINILLILAFLKEFKQMRASDRNKILDVVITTKYKSKLQEILGS